MFLLRAEKMLLAAKEPVRNENNTVLLDKDGHARGGPGALTQALHGLVT